VDARSSKLSITLPSDREFTMTRAPKPFNRLDELLFELTRER